VSNVPPEIAGLGPSAMKLRVSPGFDPLKAQVGPDEYFVLSRIDGTQTIRDVLLSTGLPIDRGIAIVTKLRSIGALLLPGEASAPMPAVGPKATPQRTPSMTPAEPITPAHGVPTDIARAPTISVTPAQPFPAVAVPRTETPHMALPNRMPARPASESQRPAEKPAVPRTKTPHMPITPTKRPAPPSTPPAEPPTESRTQYGVSPGGGLRPPADLIDPPTVRRASTGDIQLVLPNATPDERKALAEPGDLGPDERLRILALARLVRAHDPWALLGVPNGADAKVLKRAYFKLSKEVHPDRFYGKKLGSFADRLSEVFEAISRAYARLTSNEKDRHSAAYQAVAEQPQTPAEYATELFERACGLEVGGDALGAMKLFAAAVRIDPQTRYLRRAASCALSAEQPKTALEYAKKAQAQAPNDPSSARLLASAFKATGRLADAEEVLVMAMALKNENDVLTAELRNDLAEVRRLMAASGG
jgi:hypothetical protein